MKMRQAAPVKKRKGEEVKRTLVQVLIPSPQAEIRSLSSRDKVPLPPGEGRVREASWTPRERVG